MGTAKGRGKPGRARSEAWASEQLAEVGCGDPRQLRRLHAVASGLHRSPGASVPEALVDWAEVKGAYRLAESEVFSERDVLASHAAATVRRLRATPAVRHVLVAQDTTSLNYADRPGTTGLGPIGNNAERTLGLFAHAQLCLDADTGTAFGLLGAELWARDPAKFKRSPAGARNRQPLAEKESYRWLAGYQAAQRLAATLGAGTTVTSVADREGDIYELFAAWQDTTSAGGPAAQLLIRAQHNRALAADELRSHDAVRASPVQASVTVEVPAAPGRKARSATLAVRFGRVTLQPPAHREKMQPPSPPLPAVTLSLVIATEPAPPPGEPPLEWILWCSQPVTDATAALERLAHYRWRWQIEVLHRILKTGCRTEERQFTTATRLKLFLALDLMIAVYLLGLTHAARRDPRAPAAGWFSAPEQAALCRHASRPCTAPALPSPLDLHTAMRLLGLLGGHLGRTHDGMPGPQCLWRGLRRLSDLTLSSFPDPSPESPPTCG